MGLITPRSVVQIYPPLPFLVVKVTASSGFPRAITVVVMSVIARRWVVIKVSGFSLFRVNVCDYGVVEFTVPCFLGLRVVEKG